MTQRKRKLAGAVALLLLISVYAMLALAIAIVLQVHEASKLAELAYYVVAGLLWVLPVGSSFRGCKNPKREGQNLRRDG